MAKDEKQNERQRALYMSDNDYKIACMNAEKYNCSFSKYINELNQQFTIKKQTLIIKNK